MTLLRVSFLILFMGLSLKGMAQSDNEQKILAFDDFFQLIMENHPVVRQSLLLSERARQEIRIARGIFDPTINSRYSQEQLDGKRYYHLLDNTLRVPTWFGPDFYVGYERNIGEYVNQERVTPQQGLAYAGITIPLGQGLFIDQRRSTIRQAEILPDLAEAERVNIINRLLLQAARDYWNWTYNYNRWILFTQGYELAAFRAEAVKQRVIMGDLAGIDSVEANIEVQNRSVLMNEAEVDFRNATLRLSNYIWDREDIPLEIGENTFPDMQGTEIAPVTLDSLENLKNLARTNHPMLVNLELRGQQLDIERRFRADRLKPRLNFDYNLLQRNFPINGEDINANFFTNNYKYGLYFAFPIFLRQERGNLELVKLRQKDLSLSLRQQNREVVNTIQAAYNEMVVFENQITIQQNMVNNMQRLRDGEQRRFEEGESSVFLINTREMNLITAQVRLYDLISRYAVSKNMLQWAAGKLTN